MKRKRNSREIENKEPERETDEILSLPSRFLNWLQKPGNLQNFQMVLSFQSLVLAALYSYWQSQTGGTENQFH